MKKGKYFVFKGIFHNRKMTVIFGQRWREVTAIWPCICQQVGARVWKNGKSESVKKKERSYFQSRFSPELSSRAFAPWVCVAFFLFFFFFFHHSACQEFLACCTMKVNRTGLNRHPGSRRTHQVQLRSGGGTHCDLRHPGPQTTGTEGFEGRPVLHAKRKWAALNRETHECLDELIKASICKSVNEWLSIFGCLFYYDRAWLCMMAPSAMNHLNLLVLLLLHLQQHNIWQLSLVRLIGVYEIKFSLCMTSIQPQTTVWIHTTATGTVLSKHKLIFAVFFSVHIVTGTDTKDPEKKINDE